MSKKDEVAEPPGLEDISDLFPPSAPYLASPVANVSMKLPAFWPNAAEVWFRQVDEQFAICNLTVSKTKFYNAVAVLPQEVASQILDLIRAPSFEALVSLPLSGDQKPLHLMNRMLALLPDDYKPDFMLRGLFH